MSPGLEKSRKKPDILSEQEQELKILHGEIRLLLSGMAAPITDGRDTETGKLFFRINEKNGGRITFDEFEKDYRKLGDLLEKLKTLRGNKE